MDFSENLLARFRWIGGHADILGLLADGAFLAQATEALATPFQAERITKVAGVEARGFVLGTAVALDLAAGFVAIRKPGSIHPGAKASVRTAPDWRGTEQDLLVQKAALTTKDRVLLVDDWIETGSQALAARRLIEDCGAHWVGLSVLVDQTEPETRNRLEPLCAVVGYEALPQASGVIPEH